jgi:hypothetical protein
MFKNLLSFLLICSIILISNNFAPAQTRGSWADIQKLVNREIAVKTRTGKTIYGILKSAGDSGIKFQAAEKKGVGTNETFLAQNEIEKIWRANLFINRRKTAKGALIGAVIGSAAMGGIAVGQIDDDPLAGAGFIIGAIPGALVGGTIGFFSKKKHRKTALVFEK